MMICSLTIDIPPFLTLIFTNMEVSKNEGIPWYTRKKTSIFMGFPLKKKHPGASRTIGYLHWKPPRHHLGSQVGNGTHLGLQQFWLPAGRTGT